MWRMSYVENPGAAWGLFRDLAEPATGTASSSSSTLAALGFILCYLPQAPRGPALPAGGALAACSPARSGTSSTGWPAATSSTSSSGTGGTGPTSTGPPSTWPTRSSWWGWPCSCSTPGEKRAPAGKKSGAAGVHGLMLPILFQHRDPGGPDLGCSRWAWRWPSSWGAPLLPEARGAKDGKRPVLGRGALGRQGRRGRRCSSPSWPPGASGVLDETIRLPLHTYGLSCWRSPSWPASGWPSGRRSGSGQDPQQVADLVLLDPGRRRWWEPGLLHPGELERLLRRATPWSTTRVGRIPRFLALWEGRTGLLRRVHRRRRWPRRCTCARHEMPFLPYADTLIPSVAFGHFLGRLGCFGAGCCWGRSCDPALPWAAHFPPESLAYPVVRGAARTRRAFLAAGPPAHPAHPPDAALRVARASCCSSPSWPSGCAPASASPGR